MVSEYGAISKPHEAYEPFFGDLQPEEYSWRSGQAIWCAFDYGSIAGRQGLKGILQHNRLPKRSWYWYRNAYRNIPPPTWPSAGTPAKLQLTADKVVIGSPDGTDDCQLSVTVLDAAGRAISNCPAITLTVESGPGEFPTGASIRFERSMDIPVIDGQAAIALRSYFAGETLIRATSPGLVDATIVLTTLGEPAFIPGQTPAVSARPYVPPKPSAAANAAMKNAVNVARDRPSRASSEAQGHPANHGNGADDSMYWQASERDRDLWYQVDLEGYYELSSIRLVFSSAANFRYVIALSDDGVNWTPRIDRSQTVRTDAARHDVFDPGTVGRYVRARFVSIPPGAVAGLRTVDIQGILSVR
jgi:hypothetical protein